MSADQAKSYHAHQIGAFAEAQADMVTAITMMNANEAIGIRRAAMKAGTLLVIDATTITPSPRSIST